MTPPPARTGRGKGKKSAAQQRAAERLGDYRAMRRLVQPHVSFTIPKTYHPSSAKKLAKYHLYLFGNGRDAYGVASGVKIPVRRKDPVVLEKLKERFGQAESQGGLPGVKSVFIPTYYNRDTGALVRPLIRPRKHGPDVIVFRETTIDKRGRERVRSEAVTMFLPFDKDALARDARAEVERVTAELMAHLDIDDQRLVRFRITNGSSQIAQEFTLGGIAQEVMRKMSDYSAGKTATDPSHYWGHWLDGITAETATTQMSLVEYEKARDRDSQRKEKIKKVNTQWAGVLKSLEGPGDKHTEALALRTRGTLDDTKEIKRLLTEMRSRGLVTGDDNRWIMTRQGLAYLSDVRALLPLYNL